MITKKSLLISNTMSVYKMYIFILTCIGVTYVWPEEKILIKYPF